MQFFDFPYLHASFAFHLWGKFNTKALILELLHFAQGLGGVFLLALYDDYCSLQFGGLNCNQVQDADGSPLDVAFTSDTLNYC